MGRLIFVEGFPGAGKSTTAQFLVRQLARHGRRARWVYEAEEPNPFVPSAPAGGYQSWEQFADLRVARWRAFAAAAVDHDVTVVPESALLQLPVFIMLRRDVDPASIGALVRRLLEAAASLHPVLVYLSRSDPEAALRAIGQARGFAWLLQRAAHNSGCAFNQARGLSGFAALFAYWRAHAELCGSIVERLDVPKLVLEIDGEGWAARRRRICDFADVPFEDEPQPDAAELARYAGRYTDGKREVTIELTEGRLVLRGGLWPSARLSVKPEVFDVESWPLRLHFDRDAAGQVNAYRCSGPRFSWGDPSGVFRRIA
jgi:hypothetical protein